MATENPSTTECLCHHEGKKGRKEERHLKQHEHEKKDHNDVCCAHPRSKLEKEKPSNFKIKSHEEKPHKPKKSKEVSRVPDHSS